MTEAADPAEELRASLARGVAQVRAGETADLELDAFALVTDDERAKGRALVAKAIVDAIPDEAECLNDEEACFEIHPVHLGWSVEGEVRTVYARVAGTAEIVIAALIEAGWRPPATEEGSCRASV